MAVSVSSQSTTFTVAKMTAQTAYLFCAILLGFFINSDAACSWPMQAGTWQSSYLGDVLTVNSVNISGYTISDTLGQDTFECLFQDGNTYIGKSTLSKQLLVSVNVHYYICLELVKLNDYKYLYYLQKSTNNLIGGNRVVYLQNDPNITSSVCDTTMATEEFYMMVLDGQTTSLKTDFEANLQGNYNYTYDSQCGSDPTVLDTCSDRGQFKVNLTACSTKVAFSAGGQLNLLHYISKNSVTYASMYNLDSSGIDNSNYYQFVCMVVNFTNPEVEISFRGKSCASGQTATSTGNSEKLMTGYQTYSCPAITTPVPITTTTRSKAERPIFHVCVLLMCLISLLL